MKINIDFTFDAVKLIVSAFSKRLEDLDRWIEYAEEVVDNDKKILLNKAPNYILNEEIYMREASLDSLKKQRRLYESYIDEMNKL